MSDVRFEVIEYIPPLQTAEETEDASGKGAKKILGFVAAIAMPWAAPAIASAIGLSGTMSTIFGAAAGTITRMGAAAAAGIVGAAGNAAVAFATGARGADVWRAAAAGGFAGANAIGSTANAATSAARGAAGITDAGVRATQSVLNNFAAPLSSQVASSAARMGIGSSVVNAVMSGGREILGRLDADRVFAAITQAAANGQNIKGLEQAVAARRAELAQQQQTNNAVWQQQMNVAQQILADADRLDPHWRANLSVADYAAGAARQDDEALRERAVSAGGTVSGASLAGTRQRSALTQARAKPLVYNDAYYRAQAAQTATRNAGAALLRNPDYTPQNTSGDLGIQLRGAKNTATNNYVQILGDAFAPKAEPYPDRTPKRTAANAGISEWSN